MLSFNQAAALLSQIDGCTFAALDSLTVPVLKGGKKNPFQGKIEKAATGHRVMLFSNKQSNGYENKVRRMLASEGKNPSSFVLSPLPWGERIPESPFIHNNGKYYLQCVFLESGEIEYRATDTIDLQTPDAFQRFHAGTILAAETIQGLKEDDSYIHQGLEPEDAVIVRTYCLDNIVALRAFNEQLA